MRKPESNFVLLAPTPSPAQPSDWPAAASLTPSPTGGGESNTSREGGKGPKAYNIAPFRGRVLGLVSLCSQQIALVGAFFNLSADSIPMRLKRYESSLEGLKAKTACCVAKAFGPQLIDQPLDLLPVFLRLESINTCKVFLVGVSELVDGLVEFIE